MLKKVAEGGENGGCPLGGDGASGGPPARLGNDYLKFVIQLADMGRGGEEAASPRAPQAFDLHSDSRFTPFLSDTFDAAEFASNALEDTRTTAQAQIDVLQSGIGVLDAQLRSLVLHHRSDLLAHTSKLDETDVSLQRISLSVRSLQSVAARVRAEVMEPHAAIATRTAQLGNVQATVDLLRATVHRLKLVQRLRAEVAASNTSTPSTIELAKAGRLLADIAAADAAADLSGLDAVDTDAEFLAATGATVRAQIGAALRAGLDSLSQAEVGSALQALYNLGELREAVEAHVDASVSALERAFSGALDARKLSSSTPGGGGAASGGVRGVVGALQGATARVQEALWERLGEALEGLWRAAVATWHLQRVLLRKRDPLTHEAFIDVVSPPLDRFWAGAVTALRQVFASAFSAQRGGFVREALGVGYPRLAAALEATCARIAKDGAGRETPDALTPAQAAAVLAAPADAEEAFLSGVAARLQAAAAAAFPGGSRALPTAADIQTLVARAHEELKGAAAGGERLAALTAAVAGASLQACAERAEVMAAGGPDVRAVGGACTPAQARNIALCNALQEVHRSAAALAPRLPAPAAAALLGPLDAVQGTALDLVAPLFRAMVDAAQEKIIRLHGVDLSGGDTLNPTNNEISGETGVTETSPYMRDLVRLLTQCRVEYLSKFTPPPALAAPGSSAARALVERMSGRVLVFFVRHAALARPLSRQGQLQLAKDAGELEAAVAQQLLPAEALGAPLRGLRAFRRLLFTETGDVEGAAALRDLPRVAVLHHLFSRAPAAIESPHSRSKLSPAQYSLWLDEHSQEEAVKFIKTAAEAGAARAGGDASAAAVVALIKRLADQ